MNIRVKEILKEKGLTQIDLAGILGVEVQTVRDTLNAKSMTTKNLERYAHALEVPLWQLFVSPDEVSETASGFTCPHCGKPINIEIK